MIAIIVIPESGLVQEGILMTPTRVETRHCGHQIMATDTPKPWDTSWCSEKSFSSLSRPLDSKLTKKYFLAIKL